MQWYGDFQGFFFQKSEPGQDGSCTSFWQNVGGSLVSRKPCKKKDMMISSPEVFSQFAPEK